MTDLNQLLADTRSETQVLRRAGQVQLADYVTDLCDKFAEATEDYRVFISESDARLRSGWSVARLRRQFGAWKEESHAEMRGRVRYYRRCVIATRPDIAAAREAGRRGQAA